MSERADRDYVYPIAIDLRRSWGLRQAGELIRRHFNDLGLDDQESDAIKAFRRKSLVFMLDGFDEIGSQAWSNDAGKLRTIRAKALEGVKDIIVTNGGGSLVAGREHYFTNYEEMFSALGLKPNECIVIRSKDEFSETELLEYFRNRDIDADVPNWLPRRPLICQTIGELASDELDSMFGENGDEISFWNHFIKVLCERDASIHVSFDPDTIFKIFVHLARITRTRSADVGPVGLLDLQSAFEAATGVMPAEDAAVLLQRLPSLGRVGRETVDLQFVDIYILDGLRAKDIVVISRLDDAQFASVATQRWANPLGDLGQRVLAADLSVSDRSKLNLIARAKGAGNLVLASDVFASMLRESAEPIDFEGSAISEGEFLYLTLSERESVNFNLSDCIIGELELPAKQVRNSEILNCLAHRVTGISSPNALPSWIKNLSSDTYDSVANIARIRRIGLLPAQEIFIAIVRKTFFQKGAGRKEEALLRGLGRVAAKGLPKKILNLMLREGLLESFKGNEGEVYSPVRNNTARMQKILDELSASRDPLWEQISKL